jgi:predicted nuclease of predicted toxin-antitoxin system
MERISFYFDEMMPRIPADELTRRGYTVVMAADAGMSEKDDLAEHLPFATQQNLVLVTFDRKFAGLAAQAANHSGVICLSGSQDNFGYMINTLIEIAEQYTPETIAGAVIWR